MTSYYTLLNALYAKVTAADKVQVLINKYAALDTDEERISLTLEIMLENNVTPDLQGNVKDASKSRKLREEGNSIFVASSGQPATYVRVFKSYTSSIAYAPYPSEELSLGYANRSAVLYKLQKYEECIKDIERALSYKCAEHIAAKLYVRKIECLIELQRPDAGDIVKDVERALAKMSIDDSCRAKLNKKLCGLTTKVATSGTKEHGPRKSVLPTIKSYNMEAPCASDAVAIKYDEFIGRHVVAVRHINVGEVIAIERPYSQILSPKNLYTHCSYCYEVSWVNIPCKYCCYAMYCSQECMALDWEKYHDIECPVFSVLISEDFVKLDLLSLRLAIHTVRKAGNISDLRKVLEEMYNWTDPRTLGFSKDGTFLSDAYTSALSLTTNIESRRVNDIFRRCMDSCFALYLVATRTDMFGSAVTSLSDIIKNTDATLFGGLVLRYQQITPCNGHSCYEFRGCDTAERTLALLPFHSLLNHSCDPQVTRCVTGDSTICIALRPIPAGEQVFDSYSSGYLLVPKAERQAKLLKQFFFKCECRACWEDWPTYFELESYTDVVKNRNDIKKIQLGLRKFEWIRGITDTEEIVDEKVVKYLTQMITMMVTLLAEPTKELAFATETLQRVYDLCGNRYDIPKL